MGQGHLLTSSCSPQAPAGVSPRGGRVKRWRGRENISLGCYYKTQWNSGPRVSQCPLAGIWLPGPTSPRSPSASQIQGVFLQWIFHFHRKARPAAGVGQAPAATCTHTARNSRGLCSLQMLLRLCCWGIALTPPFIPGSSQTSEI